jgi:hypothetical protein
MKRGKEFRDPRGQPTTRNAPAEIPVLMFVMVEKATGAFTLRYVANDTVIDDLRKQGALDTFLADADELLVEWVAHFSGYTTIHPHHLHSRLDILGIHQSHRAGIDRYCLFIAFRLRKVQPARPGPLHETLEQSNSACIHSLTYPAISTRLPAHMRRSRERIT